MASERICFERQARGLRPSPACPMLGPPSRRAASPGAWAAWGTGAGGTGGVGGGAPCVAQASALWAWGGSTGGVAFQPPRPKLNVQSQARAPLRRKPNDPCRTRLLQRLVFVGFSGSERARPSGWCGRGHGPARTVGRFGLGESGIAEASAQVCVWAVFQRADRDKSSFDTERTARAQQLSGVSRGIAVGIAITSHASDRNPSRDMQLREERCPQPSVIAGNRVAPLPLPTAPVLAVPCFSHFVSLGSVLVCLLDRRRVAPLPPRCWCGGCLGGLGDLFYLKPRRCFLQSKQCSVIRFFGASSSLWLAQLDLLGF